MNYLVTGGAGFIGSNLVDRLLSEGHFVVCIDNFDNFYSPSLKWGNIKSALANKKFSLIEGDIREKKVLHDCFRNNQIDTVIHLAAKAGVRSSIQHQETYYDVNVIGTLKLLEVMQKFNCRKMIFASSSSIYGNNKKIPFSETDNVDYPVSPYAATKKAGELLCYTFHSLYNFDIFCLRFFSVFGPRQRPDMAISSFLKNISENKSVKLYGDGSSQRDYTYIIDIIDGICSSINKLKDFEIINLGTSKTVSLLDLIHIIEEITGRKAQLEYLPAQSGDALITYADISKAIALLNYKPSVDIEEGIKEIMAKNKELL